MCRGRGSAVIAVAIMVTTLIVLHIDAAQAATYRVGDANGWSFNVANWPKGNRFTAGDILFFKYKPEIHSVVVVNKIGYNNCTIPRGAKVFKSGKDHIKLAKGKNYFICGFRGHCLSGMKIAITAL